jgi:hypothetical protein
VGGKKPILASIRITTASAVLFAHPITAHYNINGGGLPSIAKRQEKRPVAAGLFLIQLTLNHLAPRIPVASSHAISKQVAPDSMEARDESATHLIHRRSQPPLITYL